jgi:phenylacetate-CoA ligase
MIWNETMECMDREQLREIQSQRLVKMAEYVYYNTPFYRKKFQEMGLEPGDIKSIDDITKLPFTTNSTSATTIPLDWLPCP